MALSQQIKARAFQVIMLRVVPSKSGEWLLKTPRKVGTRRGAKLVELVLDDLFLQLTPPHHFGNPEETAGLVVFDFHSDGTLPADGKHTVALEKVHLQLRVESFDRSKKTFATLLTEDLFFVFVW